MVSLLTLAVALSIPVFVEGEIAVVYIMLVLLAGGVAMSFWESPKAKESARRRKG